MPATTGRVVTADERTTAATITGGSSLEAIGGGIAVALAIVALAEVRPPILLPVAAIVLDGSILFAAASCETLAA